MSTTNPNALTVTYGSFTVVLDGHENPFELLRQVTDYYREIALSDPNFGAVPSTIYPTKNNEKSPEKSLQPVVSKLDLPEPITPDAPPEAQPQPAALPLVLHSPVPQQTQHDITQINTAREAISTPEEITQPKREINEAKVATLKSRSPFRHFPARRPSGQ